MYADSTKSNEQKPDLGMFYATQPGNQFHSSQSPDGVWNGGYIQSLSSYIIPHTERLCLCLLNEYNALGRSQMDTKNGSKTGFVYVSRIEIISEKICTDVVTSVVMNPGSLYRLLSTLSRIHLKNDAGFGSAFNCFHSSDCTRSSGNRKLRPRSSKISIMRSLLLSSSVAHQHTSQQDHHRLDVLNSYAWMSV